VSPRKAVLFDLYGTLVLTHERPEAWDAWQRKLIEFTQSLGGDSESKEASELLEHFWQGDDKPAANGMTIFEYRISAFIEKLDLKATPEAITETAGELCETWQGYLDVDPVAEVVIGRLSQSFVVGLVTNFDHPPHVHRTLQAHGLSGRFETIVVSAEEGIKKPDPEILRRACKNIGCDPADALYVGDSLVDYQAAIGAGIVPVIIRREGQGEIENTRDIRTSHMDADRFLYEQAQSGELTMIQGLEELPDLAAELL
jgi:putative hydrolase of the HAD superfamily